MKGNGDCWDMQKLKNAVTTYSIIIIDPLNRKINAGLHFNSKEEAYAHLENGLDISGLATEDLSEDLLDESNWSYVVVENTWIPSSKTDKIPTKV